MVFTPSNIPVDDAVLLSKQLAAVSIQPGVNAISSEIEYPDPGFLGISSSEPVPDEVEIEWDEP